MTRENSQPKLRVLAITPKLPKDREPGSNAPLLRQIESLRERGVEVEIIDMAGIPMLKYLLAIPKMYNRLRHVDIVHGHFGFCGWLGRLQFSKPLVISFMGDDLLGEPTESGGLTRFSRFMVQANKRLAPLAQRVIVKSAEMSRVIAPTASNVVANGVDTELFYPIDKRVARERLGWNLNQRVVLFPGNPENPRKGHALAVYSTKHAEQLLNDDIRLQPMWGVKPNEVPLYMNACDAMWMTSMIEGSPNVVKEALACNLPIAAVPVGDTVELLTGVQGCEVRPRDPKQLGEAMAKLLSSGVACEGRSTLERHRLDLASVAEKVESVYFDLLGMTDEVTPSADDALAESR